MATCFCRGGPTCCLKRGTAEYYKAIQESPIFLSRDDEERVIDFMKSIEEADVD